MTQAVQIQRAPGKAGRAGHRADHRRNAAVCEAVTGAVVVHYIQDGVFTDEEVQ